MSEALRHLMPETLHDFPMAAVGAYAFSVSAFSLAAGIALGWIWGRQ